MLDRITVAVVDDHPVFRAGLVATFRPLREFEVVAQGVCADDAVRICDEHRPNVILLDISMPGDGLKVVPRLVEGWPETKILILSAAENEDYIIEAFSRGALGYMSKGVSSTDLLNGTAMVARGERYVTPGLGATMLVNMHRKAMLPAAIATARLTQREDEILGLVADGLTNKEVARRLKLSEKTIKHYMTAIMNKLQVRNRVEATLAARNLAQGSPPSR